MAHEVVWTRAVLEEFKREACLNEFQTELMETRISGMTIRQQAFYFHRSEATISREIRKLKKLYDEAQKHSEILRPRKQSVYEDYMDDN